MKRILAIGIVLLALLALTGMVSAATEGKADLQADLVIAQPSVDLTVSGYYQAWPLVVGQNLLPKPAESGCSLYVRQENCKNGVTVTVADKLDDSKPKGTEGKMVSWEKQQWNEKLVLSQPIQYQAYGDISPYGNNCDMHSSSWTDLTGTDSKFLGLAGGIIPTVCPENKIYLSQWVNGNTDQSGHYRIVLTFTATPN